MDNLGVIDRFLAIFIQYIDSGFGLLGGEVAWLTGILVALDVTLAGLFWALGGTDDVIAKLLKKILYVGAFAFILNNFNQLSAIIFHSFAGLGLTATGSALTEAELLQPGRLAAVGVAAGRPILAQIGNLAGFPEVFLNIDSIAVLFLAWLVVIVSFFVLAVQLFVTLIEFKLTTLAGFVLVPFALWNRTAFLAERVLGNVVASGIKVLVLAVIVGIGSSLFGEFTAPTGTDPSLDVALATMLGALALFGLGIYGPGIAAGLVAGAPQLGAGAAAGTALAASGLAVTIFFLLVLVLELQRGRPAGSVGNLGATVLGVFYVGWLGGHLGLLRQMPRSMGAADELGARLVYFTLLITWAGDSGAYFVGRWLGRRPLFAAVSPRKTIEGSLGGVAASILAGLVGGLWIVPMLGIRDSVLLGLVAGIVGPIGDLVESLLKRDFGVKDAGELIPGHGGVLDRFDSLFFVTPVVYYYLKYLVFRV